MTKTSCTLRRLQRGSSHHVPDCEHSVLRSSDRTHACRSHFVDRQSGSVIFDKWRDVLRARCSQHLCGSNAHVLQ